LIYGHRIDFIASFKMERVKALAQVNGAELGKAELRHNAPFHIAAVDPLADWRR
jgi:hypothetical protein